MKCKWRESGLVWFLCCWSQPGMLASGRGSLWAKLIEFRCDVVNPPGKNSVKSTATKPLPESLFPASLCSRDGGSRYGWSDTHISKWQFICCHLQSSPSRVLMLRTEHLWCCNCADCILLSVFQGMAVCPLLPRGHRRHAQFLSSVRLESVAKGWWNLESHTQKY